MKFTAIRENHLYSKAYAKGKKAVTGTVIVYVLRDYAARLRATPHRQKVSSTASASPSAKGRRGSRAQPLPKRLLREAMRAVERDPGVKTGFLVVLAAREKTAAVKCSEVERDLRRALGKLDMLLPPKV